MTELKRYTFDEIAVNLPKNTTEFYIATEADSVMDAYEQRIKELKNKNRNLRYSSDMWMACCKLMSEGKRNVMSSDAIAEMNRIKELEADNARLKAQVPKWVSVKNRLPNEGGRYFVAMIDTDGEKRISTRRFYANINKFANGRYNTRDNVYAWMEKQPPKQENEK